MRCTALLLILVLTSACEGRSGESAPVSAADQRAAAAEAETALISAAFAAEGAIGTMLIRRVSDGREWVHSPARADSAYLPASTFKIPNAAIALETGVAAGADDRYEWDGVERGNAAWNQDHTLQSAMAVSAVPVYQRIAREIGPDRMSEWLRRIDYGNADISGGIDQFWLSGGLRTSAREQVDFISRFATGESAFSPRTVDVVADMIQIGEGAGWSLHAKTGWADEAEIGWWSGWTRVNDEIYVFALNMEMPNVESAPKRIAIGRAALSAIGALPTAAE